MFHQISNQPQLEDVVEGAVLGKSNSILENFDTNAENMDSNSNGFNFEDVDTTLLDSSFYSEMETISKVIKSEVKEEPILDNTLCRSDTKSCNLNTEDEETTKNKYLFANVISTLDNSVTCVDSIYVSEESCGDNQTDPSELMKESAEDSPRNVIEEQDIQLQDIQVDVQKEHSELVKQLMTQSAVERPRNILREQDIQLQDIHVDVQNDPSELVKESMIQSAEDDSRNVIGEQYLQMQDKQSNLQKASNQSSIRQENPVAPRLEAPLLLFMPNGVQLQELVQQSRTTIGCNTKTLRNRVVSMEMPEHNDERIENQNKDSIIYKSSKPTATMDNPLLDENSDYIDVTCGTLQAKLHRKRFICPGVDKGCIEYKGKRMTPKRFYILAKKGSLKDWKRAILINGKKIRWYIDSGLLDFYNHKDLCTGRCRSKLGNKTTVLPMDQHLPASSDHSTISTSGLDNKTSAVPMDLHLSTSSDHSTISTSRLHNKTTVVPMDLQLSTSSDHSTISTSRLDNKTSVVPMDLHLSTSSDHSTISTSRLCNKTTVVPMDLQLPTSSGHSTISTSRLCNKTTVVPMDLQLPTSSGHSTISTSRLGNKHTLLPTDQQQPTYNCHSTNSVLDTSFNTDSGFNSSNPKTTMDVPLLDENSDYIDVTCGLLKAKLHRKRFVCPGVNKGCIEYNGKRMTPKRFYILAKKGSLKDWKRAILINGKKIRWYIDSGMLDFYNHKDLCTGRCKSNLGNKATLQPMDLQQPTSSEHSTISTSRLHNKTSVVPMDQHLSTSSDHSTISTSRLGNKTSVVPMDLHLSTSSDHSTISTSRLCNKTSVVPMDLQQPTSSEHSTISTSRLHNKTSVVPMDLHLSTSSDHSTISTSRLDNKTSVVPMDLQLPTSSGHSTISTIDTSLNTDSGFNLPNVIEGIPITESYTEKKRAAKRMIVHRALKKKRVNRMYEFFCDTCNMKFTRRYRLHNHVLTHIHNGPIYTCKRCYKRFLTQQEKDSHERTHDKHLLECDKCGMRFPTNASLNRHEIKVHEKCKPCLCHVCGKSFYSDRDLKKHGSVHVNEKKVDYWKKLHHLCDICGRSFTRRHCLKKHALVHNKEKMFKCSHCNKGFNEHNALELHLKTHQKFVCDICSEICEGKRELRRHKMTHNKKAYQCDQCEASFDQNCNLTKHKVIHLGLKPYKCHMCDSSYAHRSNLNKHLKTAHNLTPKSAGWIGIRKAKTKS